MNSILHIVSVVAVIRNRDGKYLVLKRRDDEVAYPGMYTFPGGKVEGEETIEETLTREVREECGLELKPGKVLLKDKAFTRPDGQTTKVFSFLCDVERDGPIGVSADFTDYRWVTRDELNAIQHVGIDEELRLADAIAESRIPLSLIQTSSVKE